jgi:hypothetical protein
MTRDEFVEKLRADERLKAVDAEASVRALGLHLADAETILGWMVLEATVAGNDGSHSIDLAVVSDLHFLLVHLYVGGTRFGDSRFVVSVRSTAISRVRSVDTLQRLTGSDAGTGSFRLDIAGPFKEDGVSFEVKKGWPTDEVRAFLAAIATAQGWPLRRKSGAGDGEE